MKDEAQTISKNKEKKRSIVAELTEKVQKAKAIVFSNYQGMTHQQIETLKKALKKVNAELVVAKNTLMIRAIETTGVKTEAGELKEKLQQPTITLLAYEDTVTPLKELTKSFKALMLPQIKFGLAKRDPASQDISSDNWYLLAENDVIRLSTLPPRDMLIAQFVGGLKSPLYGLHRALSWNMKTLVVALKAIEQKKQTV